MKSRCHFYLDDTLLAQLDALTAAPGTSKSAIVADGLRTLLERRGSTELDDLLKGRFDRVNAHMNRLERRQDIILESFALFILYYLTITAPVPKTDKAARAVGQDRFQAFVEQVGRRISSGQGLGHTLAQRAEEPVT